MPDGMGWTRDMPHTTNIQHTTKDESGTTKNPEKKRENHLPQIQHRHSILQPRPLNIQLHHPHLGLPQRLPTLLIQTSRILHSRPQHAFENLRADFIMLVICFCRLNRNGPLAQQLHIPHFRLVARFQRGRGNGGEAVG
jgi:hypothetical protein